jgi:hypothetical protein
VIFDIKRLTKLAGEDFSSSKCRVRNPHITARDSIEIGSYIVAQEKRIAELENKYQTSCKSWRELVQVKEESIAELEWLLEYKNAVIDAQEEYHRKAKGGAL